MNIWDYIIIAVLTVAVAAAMIVIIKNKSRGKSCCGDCSKCGGCAEKER